MVQKLQQPAKTHFLHIRQHFFIRVYNENCSHYNSGNSRFPFAQPFGTCPRAIAAILHAAQAGVYSQDGLFVEHRGRSPHNKRMFAGPLPASGLIVLCTRSL